MNSTVASSNSKAPFKLVYGESVIVTLDNLTGATQLSRVQTAREMTEEVSQLVDTANKELETA